MAKKITVEIISALFVLLWVYAGLTKLLAYDTFKIQLGKSPLLTTFPGVVAIVVPTSELCFAMMLLSKRFRSAGLYLSLFLIAVFTSYLIAILNFSSHIPCSCGGILGKLSWDTHIIFNLVFLVLAIVGIVLMNSADQTNRQTSSLSVE